MPNQPIPVAPGGADGEVAGEDDPLLFGDDTAENADDVVEVKGEEEAREAEDATWWGLRSGGTVKESDTGQG